MGNKLYVGNLPYSVRDGDLEQAFGAFGAVTSAKVMMERDTGRSKGFGFVEMGSDAEAQAAIEGMNGQPMGGRSLVVPAGDLRLAAHRIADDIYEQLTGEKGVFATRIAYVNKTGRKYTLLVADGAIYGINPALYSKLPYDTARDFVPVSLLLSGPTLVVAHPSLPAKNAREVIALAKAKPGVLTFASAGHGTPPHMAGELFKSLAKIDILHIPYKGAAPVTVDLLAGQVQMASMGLPPAMPYAKSGRLRVLGVSSTKRLALLSQVPTIAEAGVPGYSAPTWTGLVAPPGTPRAIVDKLNATANKLFQSKDFEEKFARVGDELAGGTPEDFAKTIKTDLAKWKDVVERSGAKLE